MLRFVSFPDMVKVNEGTTLMGRHGVLEEVRGKCPDVPIRLFPSSLMIITRCRYTSPTGTFRLIPILSGGLDSPRALRLDD